MSTLNVVRGFELTFILIMYTREVQLGISIKIDHLRDIRTLPPSDPHMYELISQRTTRSQYCLPPVIDDTHLFIFLSLSAGRGRVSSSFHMYSYSLH